MNARRITALIWKDLAELSRSVGVLIPVAIMMAVTIAIPFLLAIGLPILTGEDLAADDDFRKVIEVAGRYVPALAELSGPAAVQAFLFQQFLLFFVLIPVTAAMSLATYSIIGEKQGRSLEPLLASPITTVELLLAKTLAAMLPALAIEVVALAIYFAGVWWLAHPGVLGFLLSVRSLLIVLGLGPLATLVAMQLAVLASSRASDPRSAQQIGVLVILPVMGILVAQFAGVFFLTVPIIGLIGAGLFVVWSLLLIVGVRLFVRETILTRWK